MAGCVMAYIMLRYPNGKRKQKAFPAKAALLVGRVDITLNFHFAVTGRSIRS